jgi:hypothetical protein
MMAKNAGDEDDGDNDVMMVMMMRLHFLAIHGKQ